MAKLSDKSLGWIIFLGICALLYFFSSGNDNGTSRSVHEKETKTETAKPKPTDGSCVTTGGQVVAVSEEYLDKAVTYAVQKDEEALQKLIDAGVIIIAKEGVKVFLVKTHFATVEIRLAGDTNVYWTVIEGIDC